MSTNNEKIKSECCIDGQKELILRIMFDWFTLLVFVAGVAIQSSKQLPYQAAA
jgi:hypothetical protein